MRIARDIDVSPREGSLTVSGLQVIAVDGQPGRQVDIEATRAELMRAARAGQGGIVYLVAQERHPVVSSVSTAAERATALLSQPLTLIVSTHEAQQRLAIDRALLRQWLDIQAVPRADGSVDLNVLLDREPIQAYLEQLAGSINRPAQDAALDFDPASKQIEVLAASQVGQELDVTAGLAAIEAALLAEQRSVEVEVPVTIVQPRVDSTKIDELGIVELVAEGSSSFAGSSAERVHNIVTAADKFKHVVVAPNEDFSFNRNVGEITAANGFADGLIIAGDRTAVGIGGGVCQVSTTVFRAALNGGFPISERYAHGYVVSWYGKPGMEATIFTPDVDFRFRNDTGRHILVKSSVDPAKGSIKFSIYGTKPQRTVEIDEPVITNVLQPEKPLYQEDKSLAKGVVKQVDWAANGLDALVVRRVVNADGTVREDKFVSKYQPWRAIYLYGPGSQVPGG
jgi:vancomycin resistance protein YoaR